MLDFRNIGGNVNIHEQFIMAECLASQNSTDIKFVALARNDQIKPVKIAEIVANKRGINLKITTNPDKALEHFS